MLLRRGVCVVRENFDSRRMKFEVGLKRQKPPLESRGPVCLPHEIKRKER